ncbi:4Fe-4S dicluster domain-containing protein [Roseburia sp. MUC/MUC-530-WT-4D]|mgnify:CR=1 FL=1|uniref:Ferredoxin n=1 Tax=Roseburia porci TaxID=2605790 RepID=A0A6L5YU22_9FIRM|nr:4Fe-4S binding protein [Roseburia porci]MCI5518113.1 4Fe-4S binding protein [Roseburia sp.]MDD6742488.1 4Fe-4S binding protein [Roseburia porci]MST75875.1 4Fe-4S dicluster domain-containing protein [Roseburia porci]
MDLQTCLKKMQLVGVLAFATVDSEGAPQIRNISAIHYEENALYFFTARGKNFCKELMDDGRVQILCYTRYKEMIRLSGKAYAVTDDEQVKWRDIIFKEQPYLANVYPGDTRSIGIIFCIDQAEVEYFNLGVNPIFRETYTLGHVKTREKGYMITSDCIRCGKCQEVCPQNCIDKGTTYMIRQNNCLHCGNCYEHCPVKAIERK